VRRADWIVLLRGGGCHALGGEGGGGRGLVPGGDRHQANTAILPTRMQLWNSKLGSLRGSQVTETMKSRKQVLNLLALLGFTSTKVQTLMQNALLGDGQLCGCGDEEAKEGGQLCEEEEEELYADDPDVCVCACVR
jgi:hypothetical protein